MEEPHDYWAKLYDNSFGDYYFELMERTHLDIFQILNQLTLHEIKLQL